MIKREIDEKTLFNDYNDGIGLDGICKKYHIGKLRAKDIIRNYGGIVKKPSSFSKKRNFVVTDWKIEKYPYKEGYHYIAVLKDDSTITFNDVNNKGGLLTTTIRNKYNIDIPSLYERRIYYQETGNYWWEQWFNIECVENNRTKKCPYCGWETNDISNKSGAFGIHLKKAHKIEIEDYLKQYPEDKDYFHTYKENEKRKIILEETENYVICPICGEKYQKITPSHLSLHNITIDDFKKDYPNFPIMSNRMDIQAKEAFKLSNLTVSKNRFISKYEKEIRDYLNKNNITFETNRQILIGKEIDILIPDKKIGIEFNGLKWHTEWFGKKSHSYHLDKTLKCNEKGYGLIHIFEDEYVNHKDIVFSKIGHIIGIDYNLPKIMGRKCVVKEIYMHQAKDFLNKYHIQGFVSSSVYLGAFHNEEIIGVMCFKNGNVKNNCWELTRFATDYHYRYQGVGSKLFNYFLRVFSPHKIISFADRRWTINAENNLYTNLNFNIEKYTAPDYRYYKDESKDGQKFQRIHKMTMNKNILHKKYGFPLTMTEKEMVKELGYDRVWDCGLIKYVWKKERDS